MSAAAFLLAAVISGDFGSSPTATLWRSALDEAACSREIADLTPTGGGRWAVDEIAGYVAALKGDRDAQARAVGQ